MNGLLRDYTSEIAGHEGEKLADSSARYQFIRALASVILVDAQNYGTQRTAVYLGERCRDLVSATEQDLSGYTK